MAHCGLLLNDGSSFILLNDGHSVILLNDTSCTSDPGRAPATSAGGALAWRKYFAEQDRIDQLARARLERIRDSVEYKRLMRQIRIVEEHLAMEPNNRKAHAKLRDLERRIKLLESL
jgi:hypothetical protein